MPSESGLLMRMPSTRWQSAFVPTRYSAFAPASSPPRMPTEDGTTNFGQSSPAKPDLVHVEPMSMTIAETSSEEGERRNAA